MSKYEATKLDLSNMCLYELPNDILFYTKLIHLNINENNLQNIDELYTLNTLEYLHCENNKLSSLLKLPINLKGLSCENNHISSIQVPKLLQGLDCQSNNLLELPNLPSTIISLKITDNPFRQLTIPNNLRTIFCSRTQLSLLNKLPDNLNTLLFADDKLLVINCNIPKIIQEDKVTIRYNINQKLFTMSQLLNIYNVKSHKQLPQDVIISIYCKYQVISLNSKNPLSFYYSEVK